MTSKLHQNLLLKFNTFEIFSKLFSEGLFKNAYFMRSLKSLKRNKNYLLVFIKNHVSHYPILINLIYAWSFGFSAGICLVIQFLLVMHFTSDIYLALSSVEFIVRDVSNFGLIR
jgi:quinol-cytochrome oxidoreductase complex cytochrome b subunit